MSNPCKCAIRAHVLNASFVLAMSLLLSYGCSSHDNRNSAEETVAQLDAIELLEAYQNNVAKADQSYKGKLIEVTGHVAEIEKDQLTDEVYVTLGCCVRCYFHKGSGEVALIQKGQTISVKGECRGGEGGEWDNVDVVSCTLVKDESRKREDVENISRPQESGGQSPQVFHGKHVVGDWICTLSEVINGLRIEAHHKLSLSRIDKGNYRYALETTIVDEYSGEGPREEESHGSLRSSMNPEEMRWYFVDGEYGARGGYIVVPGDLWTDSIQSEITIGFAAGRGDNMIFQKP